MILILENDHKEHLQFLSKTDLSVAKEFCRISTEFLLKGPNPKVYQSAANKLDVDVEVVKHAVEGLMHLLTEAAKAMITEIEFRDSLLTLGLPEEINESLVQWHLSHYQELRSLLSQLSLDIPHYKNLEWRLDIQIASRSLRHQVVPSVLLKLDLEEQGKKKEVVLQSDIVNLVHMTEVLDQALQEAKSQHFRRIMRNIK